MVTKSSRPTSPGRSRGLVLAGWAAAFLAACGSGAAPGPGESVGPPAETSADAGSSTKRDAGRGLGEGGVGRDGGIDDPLRALVSAIAPSMGKRDVAATLVVTGARLPADAVVLFDGTPVPTTRQSESQLTAEIAATLTAVAGLHTVAIRAGAGAEASRSNDVSFLVAGPLGAPEILAYRPDNAAAGETIRLIGLNLIAGPLRIEDEGGHVAAGGAIGTVTTARAVLETVAFTLPSNWESGPITVSNTSGRFRGRAFNVGRNLVQKPGVKLTASSEYMGWPAARAGDNDVLTSWFTAAGDCVSGGAPMCKTVPTFTVTFPAPEAVNRISLRGDREYGAGYDFLRARIEILGAGGTPLWAGSFDLPEPDRDLDVVLPEPILLATAVRFTSEKDESEDPGFAELEIFGP